MRLKDKVAIVTGASRGIGRAVALALGGEGAKVVVNFAPGRDTGNYAGAVDRVMERMAAQGVEAVAHPADVSRKDEVDGMIQAAIERFGRIDILVNNAGICPAFNLMEVTEEVWDRTFAVNLKSVFLCTQGVARHMIARRIKGRIVGMSSISSIVGS
ncbi:MAG: SDR family NAD(P)-dependent oxidoreductase, partial [Rhodospirillales bacterium]|nr:SDR family NAD(P)-dependent oxidoreductase [Rhodospirillales bacterium]